MTNWNNKKEFNEYHKNYYHKRRNEIINYLGGKCAMCGIVNGELEIDHINPNDKTMNPRDFITRKFEKVKHEIDKCQVLCNKCHENKTAFENSGITHGTMYAWQTKGCRCDECIPAWREWNDKRNASRRSSEGRGPYSKNPECGTTAKYRKGCRCDLCRGANAQKARELRSKKT